MSNTSGSNVGDLSVTLGIDPSQFSQGLQQAKDTAQQSSQEMEKALDDIKESAQDAAASTKDLADAMKATATTGNGFKPMTQAVADLRQYEAFLQKAKTTTATATNEMKMSFEGLSSNVREVSAATKRFADANAGGGKKPGGGYGQGVLQASRAIQDFQAAGLMGIVNNVEGIAAGFGMGAGVAGMVTVATVALFELQKQFVKFIDGRTDLEKLAGQARFAGSIFGDMEIKIESAKTQLDKLADFNADGGFRKFLRENELVASMGSPLLLGGIKAYNYLSDNTEEAVKKRNEDAAFRFATIAEQARGDARILGKRQSGVEAGLNFLDQKDADQDQEKVKRRAAAMRATFSTDSRRDLLMGSATEFYAKNETNGDYTKARERAREMIGYAAQGLDEGFQAVRKITKDWQNQELNVQSSYYKLLSEENEKARQKELQGKRDHGGIDDIISSFQDQGKLEDKRKAVEDEKEGIINQMADVYYEQAMRQRKFSMVGAEDVFKANAGAGVKDPLDPLLKKLDTLGDRLEKVIDKGRRLN